MREASNRRTVTDTDSYAFSLTNHANERMTAAINNLMKRIVLLRAPISHGKSETLLTLAGMLRGDHSCYVFIDELFPNEKDEFVVVGKDGRRIAVITEGDRETEDEITRSLARCLALDVDVVYCASWTDGVIYNLIWNFAIENKYEVIECTPSYSYYDNKALCSRLNNEMAKMLSAILDV